MSTTAKSSTRKKTLYSIGALVGIGALATTAAFTDFANLNLGGGTDGSGIGAGAFNIQVVGTDVDGIPVPGTWQEADTAEGVDIAVPGADTITPGDTISVALPYRNDSEKLGADLRLWINEVPGKTSDPAYLAALRFSVAGSDGVAIVSGLTFDQFDELAESAALTPVTLAPGASDQLTLSITLADQGTEGNAALNGGVAYVQAHFDAASVVLP
ncbi:hypothetical protein [Oerskovia enterophila]|uniref:Camelysin metallo-endopeptidase n=1 Tax=Oerskovia enterophila TaxID=43678 RepID=A0ABX2XYY1_9CELL|nr:hypothetical protein [Oerskovia enterophila]OCI29502.1 hypothetical protein OERS_38160 [Oerskovia enterophila]